ncbi:uncharacterized protein LOC116346354 [Contarinia nasturtii]|uniref:uncharacterized protein LOC116346354 n=1 Tax=Contarinia nasturtii TaxID=265458 RepID=UPI0012D45FFB|nr:uncharacterized protein LOC116346354 [Contarinia nasturtii]
MNYLQNFFNFGAKSLLSGQSFILNQVRGKKVKAKGSTRNRPINTRPKHRGWKVNDGAYVSENKILVLQRNLRYHPGLNVGFGKNGTLYALTEGRVVVTCEQFNPNWDHTWVQRIYASRESDTIYKKYFNILPFEQHNRFKLIDEI